MTSLIFILPFRIQFSLRWVTTMLTIATGKAIIKYMSEREVSLIDRFYLPG